MKRFFIFLLVAVISFVSWSYTSSHFFEISKNLEILTTLYKELNSYYVDEIDPNDLMQEGIYSMLESLDPYTNFYSEADVENYRFETTGKYGGIGALIRKVDDFIVISEPYKGFPADKAGLIAGDKIVAVEEFSAVGKTTEEVSKLLKGEPGTSIEVTILRATEDAEKEIIATITREEVKIDNVPYYGMISDQIGYIKLSHFTQAAGKEVEDAFTALKTENPGMKGLVFDLRGNPGGLLNEAVNISNIWIDKGQLIVSTKGKVQEWDKEFKTLNPPVDRDLPLVVLTSRGSASASEIVSGSLQDFDRAVIIGQKTFGKGLVQTTRPLAYNTKLKVTTAKYYIPSGRCIQAIDYAERDEDGAVSKIPDSLKVEFFTQNGRSVFDGGGIDPDIVVKRERLSDISISLLNKHLIFDYATLYKATHASIDQPDAFRIDDNTYSHFVDWLADKEYEYVTESEKQLQKLEEVATEEEYIDAIQDELELLKEDMKHDKSLDLQTKKEEIKMLLEAEITKRYYYMRGAIENSFLYDDELQKAIEVLNDTDQYNTILAIKD